MRKILLFLSLVVMIFSISVFRGLDPDGFGAVFIGIPAFSFSLLLAFISFAFRKKDYALTEKKYFNSILAAILCSVIEILVAVISVIAGLGFTFLIWGFNNNFLIAFVLIFFMVLGYWVGIEFFKNVILKNRIIYNKFIFSWLTIMIVTTINVYLLNAFMLYGSYKNMKMYFYILPFLFLCFFVYNIFKNNKESKLGWGY